MFVQRAGYGGYYYSVENQGAGVYGLNLHEYLHSMVNPLVQAAMAVWNTSSHRGGESAALAEARTARTAAPEARVHILFSR